MAGRRTLSGRPSLRIERSHLGPDCALVAGMDEVGRGALAGPVTIGVVVIDAQTRTAPSGVRDSKLLTPQIRQQLAPRVRRWAVDHAVGHASAREIDDHGIMAALRMAGQRALAQLRTPPDLVILDGNHNYLTPRGTGDGTASLFDDVPLAPRVVTLIKGDMRCSSVAAASILAKTTRDAQMVEWAQMHPKYGWELNKGYSAPGHLEALRRHGPSPIHRVSWNLPRTDTEPSDQLMQVADTVGTDPVQLEAM